MANKLALYTENMPKFAVAPMMDWTDRHCRYLHRLLSRNALLYTEMVVADAIIHGDKDRLLGFDEIEHPIAVQLGGSEPEKLIIAAKACTEFGYDEINLNVGCPSDRVQSGTFGACLMREPELVAQCVEAMKSVTDLPVTVKCRIGVDDQDPNVALWDMAEALKKVGVDGLWVHARKAWLDGLSPKENRDIPPLDYDLVYKLKSENQNLFIGINGGIDTIDDALAHMEHMDGVMMGRAAYYQSALLCQVDEKFYGAAPNAINWQDICDKMIAHADETMAKGSRLIHVTRHMVGLFHGLPGARRYRQILSTDAVRDGAGPEIIQLAFDAVLEKLEAAE